MAFVLMEIGSEKTCDILKFYNVRNEKNHWEISLENKNQQKLRHHKKPQ